MDITYLLGAGASANALPTYENFRDRYNIFLKQFDENKRYPLTSTERDFAANIYSAGLTFSEEFLFHNTPDTIAKKYFHTGDSRLKLLKQILALFFLYEQIFIKKVNSKNEIIDFFDKRYDALIATILKPIEKKIELANQFSIISWNYDLQFEIAFLNYNSSKGLNDAQLQIQSLPNLFDSSFVFNVDNFSITHLNGIAYGKPTKQGDSIGKPISDLSSLQRYLMDVWSSLTDAQLLTFAWENIKEDYSLKDNTVLKNAFTISEKTEVLVVIGYSFPLFNRIIDVNLFRKMNRLEKIYIQSPQASQLQKILQTEILDRTIECIDVGYTNQFHIPPESTYDKLVGVPIAFY